VPSMVLTAVWESASISRMIGLTEHLRDNIGLPAFGSKRFHEPVEGSWLVLPPTPSHNPLP
jgi:hypothetical protein